MFAHGITDNGLCFVPIAEQLAEDFEIVLYDSRGHGRSDPSSRDTTLLERARDLGGLVEALELNKPGLLGHSLGADHGGSLCRPVPRSVPGRIVLEDPPPFDTLVRVGDPETANGGPAGGSGPLPTSNGVSTNSSRSVGERDPSWPEAERLPWARAKQQFSLTVFDEERLDDVESVERIVSQIVCPTLLITADPKLGSLFPLAAAARSWSAGLPRARHVNIPGAGHNIRREQPASVSRSSARFSESNDLSEEEEWHNQGKRSLPSSEASASTASRRSTSSGR